MADNPFRLIRDIAASRDRNEQKLLSNRLERALREQKRLPIEKDHALFSYIGAEQAFVAGDWTGWRPTVALGRLPNSQVSVALIRFASDARLEYKIHVGERLILDNLNPLKCSNGLGGENSVLEMPRYRARRYMGGASTRPLTPIHWKAGGREIKLYLPAKEAGRYPLLLFHDGLDYIDKVKADGLLDDLIRRRKIPPCVAAFVPPVDRMSEYWRGMDGYMQAIVEDLMPLLFAKAPIDPTRCVSVGASLGGLLSLRLTMDYPQVFSRALCQSGAFQVDEKGLEERLKLPLPIKVYFDNGVYESDLTAANDKLAEAILKRTNAKRTVASAGHNWTAWADRLPAALEWVMK
ncbi:MAG: hypothetical protein HUU60_07115 [Armatimonadetes bacterium]|nr:hypothetical protein [Armatimonadota bacterium]